MFFRATPMAYGSSQPRGQIGATATPQPQQRWDPNHICDLYHSSRQCRIPNPLSGARDRTCILMGSSQIHFRCAMKGTPTFWDLTNLSGRGNTGAPLEAAKGPAGTCLGIHSSIWPAHPTWQYASPFISSGLSTGQPRPPQWLRGHGN